MTFFVMLVAVRDHEVPRVPGHAQGAYPCVGIGVALVAGKFLKRISPQTMVLVS